MGFKENELEEMKLDEDEIALSETRRTGNLSLELDSSELVEWVAAVVSQLVECAEELDDDQAVLVLNEQEEKEIATSAESENPRDVVSPMSHEPFLPAPTELKSADEYSRKREPALMAYPEERIQKKAIISTLRQALPRSRNRGSYKLGRSSEIWKKNHSQQTTIPYLTCLSVAFLCVIGAVVLVVFKYNPGLTI
jgi:hypothetical protein